MLAVILLAVGAVVVFDLFGLGSKEKTEKNDKAAATDIPLVDYVGNEITLSSFKGKPVVLNFWASWCGPCKMEMPHFEKMYKELGDEVEFVMVNLTYGRETMANAKNYVDTNGFTFNVYYDTQGKASTAYNISSIPMTVFIDKDGKLVERKIGTLSEAQLRTRIENINK